MIVYNYKNYICKIYECIIKNVQHPCEMKRTQKVQTFGFQKSPRVFDPLCTTP